MVFINSVLLQLIPLSTCYIYELLHMLTILSFFSLTGRCFKCGIKGHIKAKCRAHKYILYVKYNLFRVLSFTAQKPPENPVIT